MNKIIPNKFEYLLLLALPILLIFYRGIADFTVLTIGIIFLYRSYKTKDWKWIKQTWFIFSLIFWFYLLIFNTPLSINPKESFLYSLAFIRWPLFAMALSIWLFKNNISRKYFLISMGFTLLFIILDVWWQYIFQYDFFGNPKYSFNPERLTGPFRDNPMPGIFLARYLFLLLYFGLFLKYFNHPLKNIIFIFLVLIVGASTIFITGERMAFLIFISGSLIITLGLILHFKSYTKYIVLGLFSIIGSITLFSLLFPETFYRTITSLIFKLQNFTNSDYMLVFKSAYYVWLESPIFGVGLHQYRDACINLGLWGSGGGVCFHPHNISFELLSESGVIGFTLYYVMIISVAFNIIKSFLQQKNWLILFLSLNLLFVSFFPLIGGMSLFNNWIGAIVWLFVGWVLAIANNKNSKSIV
tara:strand:+ start:172 stop:1413 length:1242 start_codon:yes stop_codon:yes gene_type:complete